MVKAKKTNTTKSKTKKQFPKNHSKLLDAIGLQLQSPQTSDNWRGMEQARKLLIDDPENQDIYGMLLDIVKVNPDLHQQIHDLFALMVHSGSKTAVNALHYLPKRIQDLMTDADDAYYAAEYSKAIRLYQMVLQKDPENQRAQVHLDKIRLNETSGKPNKVIPREALKWYNMAQSCIAAKDYKTAIMYLNAAVEDARIHRIVYSEAKQLLETMQELQNANLENRKAISFKYDVFISYSHKDENWVHNKLLTHLDAAGLRVCIDFRDFKKGKPNIIEMERAIIESRKTVLVLTSSYIKSEWAEFELLLIQTIDPAARDGRMIPVLLKRCKLPPRLKMLNYLNLTIASTRDSQLDQLVKELKSLD